MYRFSIVTLETVPQFNVNLRTQTIKGKRVPRISTVKRFEFENKRSDVKKVLQSLGKKENNMSTNQIYQSGTFNYKSYPCY